jgi:hypothetical protein
MFRKSYTIKHADCIEKRSIPLYVWLIDVWFMWAHEWPWLITKRGNFFCYPYDMYIAPWVFGHERIDLSFELRGRK